MKQMRTVAEFWPPLFAQPQVTFDVCCCLIVIYLLQTLFPFSTILKFLPLLSIFKVPIFNTFIQFYFSNKARSLLTDFKGCTKCCCATFHQLFQKVTAQIQNLGQIFLINNLFVGSDE
jgi:hypothetical protein